MAGMSPPRRDPPTSEPDREPLPANGDGANGLRRRALSLLLGTVVAVAYALLTQLAFRANWAGALLTVLSLGFLAVMPCAIGILTVVVADAEARRSWPYAIFAGWPACFILAILTIALSLDAAICLVMALPILLVGASLGGIIARAILGSRPSGPVYAVALLPLFLPFLVTPIERQIAPATSVRLVRNTIAIAAPRAVVWENVVRVPTIGDAEWHPGWTTLAGLPAPREAALSGTGIGAVRDASFADGLTFTERVVAWDEGRYLRFTIAVDRSRPVPPPFGAIGGPNFAVLDGAYTLEDRPDGTTLLVLESRERVTTHFNAYASWWTDRIMSDMQARILTVVRARSEGATR
jgi:hypothetical protein